MTELKPEFKKWLTKEILGECWHEVYTGMATTEYHCKYCRKTNPAQRTFTTWQDYGDVVTAMSTIYYTDHFYYTDHLDGYSLMHRFIEFILGVGDKCRNKIPSVLADSSFIQPYTITMTTHVNKYFINKDLFFTTLQEWWEKEWK